jgi:hypothetical protein
MRGERRRGGGREEKEKGEGGPKKCGGRSK